MEAAGVGNRSKLGTLGSLAATTLICSSLPSDAPSFVFCLLSFIVVFFRCLCALCIVFVYLLSTFLGRLAAATSPHSFDFVFCLCVFCLCAFVFGSSHPAQLQLLLARWSNCPRLSLSSVFAFVFVCCILTFVFEFCVFSSSWSFSLSFVSQSCLCLWQQSRLLLVCCNFSTALCCGNNICISNFWPYL